MLIYKICCFVLVAGFVEKLITALDEGLFLDAILATAEGAAFLYVVSFLADKVVL